MPRPTIEPADLNRATPVECLLKSWRDTIGATSRVVDMDYRIVEGWITDLETAGFKIVTSKE